MKKVTIIGFFALISTPLLYGCKEDLRRNEKLVDLKIKINRALPFKGAYAVVTNHTKEPYCFTREQLSPKSENVVVYSNNKRIDLENKGSNQNVFLRGVNVADGLDIVIPGQRVFWVELSPFNIPEDYSVKINMVLFKCSDLFGTERVNLINISAESGGG